MDKFEFWQKWLLSVGFFIFLFGLFMAFLSGSPLFQVFDEGINEVFWGSGEVEGDARNFQRWVYGTWGATVAGWGVFITFLAHYPFRRKEKWSWDCMFLGLLIWFLIDTGFSLYYRVHINVILNVILLVLGILPLALTKKFFRKQ